ALEHAGRAIDVEIDLGDVGAKDGGEPDHGRPLIAALAGLLHSFMEAADDPVGEAPRRWLLRWFRGLRLCVLGGGNDRAALHIHLVSQADEVFDLVLEDPGTQITTVFDHEHEAAGPAHPAHRWWTKDRDIGFRNLAGQPVAQLVGNRLVVELRGTTLLE